MGKWGTAVLLGENRRVIKIDPQESELKQQAAYLARLGNMGALEQRAAFAKWQMQETEAQFEKAKLIQANPSLAAAYVPPTNRWGIALLTVVAAAILALQAVTFYRTQHAPYPALEATSKADESASVAQKQKGRVSR
jgi:hypothetical protein